MKIGFARLTAFAVLSAIYTARAASAGTIADWTFQSDAIATNNNPVAERRLRDCLFDRDEYLPHAEHRHNTGRCPVGQGSSDTGANAVANTTNTWRVRGQAGTNGAANGWSSAAPIGTQGAIFAASTVGFSGPINVSFDWYATTQGDANLQLEYTTDGSTWTNLPITLSGSDAGLAAATNNSSANTVMGSYVSDNLLLNGSAAGQDWFTGLTAAINDPAAVGTPNFAIEMVNASTGADCVSTQGTALNNNSGNWRFDNISISATAVPRAVNSRSLGVGHRRICNVPAATALTFEVSGGSQHKAALNGAAFRFS